MGKVVNLVHRFGAMPRLQHIMNLFRGPRDLGRVRHGKEQLFHLVVGGKKLRNRVGNQDRIIRNFRFAKGVNPLPEGPNHSEG